MRLRTAQIPLDKHQIANLGTLLVFPATIVAVAAALMWSHWRARKSARTGQIDPVEADFSRRQFRRRMQASCLLAFVGILVFAGQVISWRTSPSLFVAIWCFAMFLLTWILVLALSDMAATRVHAGRMIRQQNTEFSELRSELGRVARDRGNGRPTDQLNE